MGAQVVICNQCERHGRIMSSSGFAGPEFAFQQAGFRFVKNGTRFKRFSAEKVKSLNTAIINSDLPFRYTGVPLLYLWKLELLNQARSSGHFLQTGFTEHILIAAINCSEDEIPQDFAQDIEEALRS